MSVRNKVLLGTLASAALVSCSGEPELDMTQAGYAAANECYVAMAGFSPIGQQSGAETYVTGPQNAREAIKKIAAQIGIDDAQVKADEAANKDKVRGIVANFRFADPKSTAIRDKAAECGEIYE